MPVELQGGRDLHRVAQLGDALLALLHGHAVDVAHEVEVLDAREELVEVRVVGDVGHDLLALKRLLLDGHAVDEDLALGEVEDAAAGLDGRGLAGAIVAEEAIDLARLDVQRQVVDGLVALFAILLGVVVDSQHKACSLRWCRS